MTILSLFNNSYVDDSNHYYSGISYELGLKFQVSVPSKVVGMLYNKNHVESGSHAGTLWDINGKLLIRNDFVNESPSGWQTLTFSSPILIEPNTLYVVSANSNYVFNVLNDYPFPISNGILSTPNIPGLEGSPGGVFPTTSYGVKNYLIDVLIDDDVQISSFGIESFASLL